MKITWLGQAGLLLENGDFQIMVDPYLSNSVAKVNPKNYRRAPVEERFLQIKPDVLIFTHNHLDHYDPETAEKILATGSILVLAPGSVWVPWRTTLTLVTIICCKALAASSDFWDWTKEVMEEIRTMMINMMMVAKEGTSAKTTSVK